MEIETKRNLLLNMILQNDEYDNSMITYKLIRKKHLEDVIAKINDLSFIKRTPAIEGKINAIQFISLLDLFVYIFRINFFYTESTEEIISEIIETNQSRFEDYLSLFFGIDDSVSDNQYIDILSEKINKLIICNFIDNVKYIPILKELLKDKNIDIKCIDDYSFKESEEIVDVLSDLVFCMGGKLDIFYLFQNIEQEIKKHLDNKNIKKKDEKDYENKLIEYYQVQYEYIIKNYNNKKEYLKYFKE